MNVILGAGGHAREVAWVLADLATLGHGDGADIFVASDNATNIGEIIHGASVIRESEFFDTHRKVEMNVFIAVGSSHIRAELHRKCKRELEAAQFPALMHSSVVRDTRPGSVRLGAGAIVLAGTSISTNVSIGAFANINLNCSISHDTEVGAYSSLSPGVHVSGNVIVGSGCFIGTGAVLIDNVRIPDDTTIGAGTTVIRSLPAPGTYVGTPARRVK